MLITCFFRFILFAVVCFCINGISTATAPLKPAKNKIHSGSKMKNFKAYKSGDLKTNVANDQHMNIMPEILVLDSPPQESFSKPSPLNEEKSFTRVKRRKAIRHKANEVYSKEMIANQKVKDNDLAISYIPDRARASITRSMHQIVVEKEQGLKPKIEYKSVKYTMMPEEGGNEIQTSLSKKDLQTKEQDFASSVSKFLIKRKYLIGSLAGMAADNKAVQYILDGQTVFNDKYLTSTADPIAFKQKSNQKSVNKLEEVKLIKTTSTKKKYKKVYDPSVKKSKRRNIEKTSEKRTDRYNVDMNTLFDKSPVTRYDKMSMFDKLKYLQHVNEKKAKNKDDAVIDKMKKKTKKVKKEKKMEQIPDVFVTRRKSIRPKQEAIQSKEKHIYQSLPLNIEIDTKDWKTNYRRKKDKLLKSMLESTNNIENISKDKKIKVKTVKEVIQQGKTHSFMIKPNTTIGVGNTEITVGIPSYASIRRPKKEGKRFEIKTTVQVKTLKPPSTLKVFRSDEIQKVVDAVTVSNTAKSRLSKVKIPKTKNDFPPRNVKSLPSPPPPPTHFPLKIEFVTAKPPSKSRISRNETVLTTTKATRKKFITNGLIDDPKNNRIITSSENLNVNLDHYADFTRTGITNGENNIVVGTLSGISDSANAGMLNLKVDTVKRENFTKTTQSKRLQRTGQSSPKSIVSDVKTSLAKMKKHRKGMPDFSISLLAAHEVVRTTPAEVRTIKPTLKTPMKKSPRFVLNNNQSRGKKFVFSFKTNKKPKVKIPEVPSIPFQPAFIYKDTAEIHRSENSLYTNSIHEKPGKSQDTYFKHNIMGEKQNDFRWPMPPPNDTIQGIPVTQPPPEVTTLGMIISGDFVSSFAEQAFKDVSSSNNILKQMPKRSKLRSGKFVKNDFLFSDQSLFTPPPRAITTMDVALAIKRRNGVYKTPGVYSSDIQKEIKALLNSTETVQLTDIPGNVEIQTSTVALPRGRDNFVPKGSEDRQFVYKAEAQGGKTKKEKLVKKKPQTHESTTSVNNMAASITGYDIGLSLKKDKSKKPVLSMTQATRAFEVTSQSPTQYVVVAKKAVSNTDSVHSPSKEIKNVILPTTATKEVVSDKPTSTTTEPTVDRFTTVLPTEAPKPAVKITSTPTPTKQTLSKLSNLNLVTKRTQDAFSKINEVFKGAPEGILAVSKTDAFKKYRKAATEVIELKKSPTMVPAVGIIKPLRKSEAIYKFSQYGNQRKQAIVEDNAIKREIKKLLIQQNTIYPATLQNGMTSNKRVTPMMDQNIFNKNNINTNSRGILYNTPEMTSMIISTESILPEQNNAYIQNYNFPGANRQLYANSARYPSYQNKSPVTLPTPINPQPNVSFHKDSFM